MEFVDTHCHIQSAGQDAGGERITREMWTKSGAKGDQLVANAAKVGVTSLICVGCDATDSQLAIDFVKGRENCWASVGIHPHEAQRYIQAVSSRQPAKPPANSKLSAQGGVADSRASSPYLTYGSVRASSAPSPASEPEHSQALRQFAGLAAEPKVVAIGECGLDYYYEHSPKKAQIEVLKFQIELALERKLPIIFHVREAFDDFWPIFDGYENIRGVLHSFTDSAANLQKALDRGLYIGVNGITTFTKDEKQLAAYRSIPLGNLLLETDAPFLAPKPYRGKINEPKHVATVAEFLAGLRGERLKDLAKTTTANARELFTIG